jgi:hypothetical protein
MCTSFYLLVRRNPGINQCTNQSSLAFVFHYSDASPGSGNSQSVWWKRVGRCRACTRQVTLKQGIFCDNYGALVDGLGVCQMSWCATCYRATPGEGFSVFRNSDEDGEELLEPDDDEVFMVARPGDTLLCPFECDQCAHFKLTGRLAVRRNAADDRILKFVGERIWMLPSGPEHGKWSAQI